jgi:hypothetical protein
MENRRCLEFFHFAQLATTRSIGKTILPQLTLVYLHGRNAKWHLSRVYTSYLRLRRNYQQVTVLITSEHAGQKIIVD